MSLPQIEKLERGVVANRVESSVEYLQFWADLRGLGIASFLEQLLGKPEGALEQSYRIIILATNTALT